MVDNYFLDDFFLKSLQLVMTSSARKEDFASFMKYYRKREILSLAFKCSFGVYVVVDFSGHCYCYSDVFVAVAVVVA